jgi:hypothetical protein
VRKDGDKMNKALISLMFVLLFVVGSCGVEDEDISCVDYEHRIVICATDENKEQDQFCVDNRWINDGSCYLCEEYEERIVKCATDESMEQPQKCRYGDWKNSGSCLCPGNNPFCRKHAGLSWSNVTPWKPYDGMKRYCSDLGGRIPTILELRSLIVNCPATESGGKCKIGPGCYSHDDCWEEEACGGCGLDGGINYSVFEEDDHLRSSTPDWDEENYCWAVNFNDASFFSIKCKWNVNFWTRCVK